VLQLLCAVGSLVLIVRAADADKRLRGHARESGSGGFLIVPLCWFQPELFTLEGDRHRRRAIRATAIAVVLWVVILVLEWVDLGVVASG